MFFAADQIREVMNNKKYIINAEPHYINIIGVRDKSNTNLFNDYICLLYKTNFWNFEVFNATTDPGHHWLKNLLNKKGTAILKEGQYVNAFKIGLHQGKYEALVQNKPLPVYRDRNFDLSLDMDENSVDIGWHGINIHRASKWSVSNYVNKWSAGCQVIKDPMNFETLMNLSKVHKRYHGNSFNYTLISIEDINHNYDARVLPS